MTLTPTAYKLEDTYFTDENGERLSYYYAVSVTFEYTPNPDIAMSELWGGSGGTVFNFLGSTATTTYRPVVLAIRSGNRLDAVSLEYSDGIVLSAGGTGGTLKKLPLASDEYVIEVLLYKNGYRKR